MRKSQGSILIGLLVVLAGIALWQSASRQTAPDAEVTSASHVGKTSRPSGSSIANSKIAAGAASAKIGSSPTTVPPSSTPTANPPGPTAPVSKERQSLDTMTKTLAVFARPGRSVQDLVAYLQRAQTEPRMIENRNDITGGMMIVRTGHLFPGTRYFHAQFFESEKKGYFPQHMSFEFKPGQSSMPQAIESVRQSFQIQGKPTIANADFMQWDLGQGYVVWIKKMGVEDLTNNPFNAYTQADIGSIRVAVELNPHEGHEHDHKHGG